MEYFERIQRVINFIENNLQNEITLDELSKTACYSAFHFHRIFQILTGESVMDYIRKRRLSCTLEELEKTEKTITEIAMLYQFNSHDGFTRAFKRCYGINPGEYRKSKNKLIKPFKKINLLEKMNFSNYRSIIMEPKIIIKESFKIIGYELRTTIENGENFKKIPEFWTYYTKNNLSGKIPFKKNKNIELGICCDSDKQNHTFSYIIGFEVENVDEIPEGMIGKVIPSSKYAVFTTPKTGRKDFSKSIQETTKFIYQKWLPESGYEINDKGYDLEWYDERCHSDDDCCMDIYIPVK